MKKNSKIDNAVVGIKQRIYYLKNLRYSFSFIYLLPGSLREKFGEHTFFRTVIKNNPNITFSVDGEFHIHFWATYVYAFATEAARVGLDFQMIAIANDPSESEIKVLDALAEHEWFSYQSVPREGFYTSWYKSVNSIISPLCTFWNADDFRTVLTIREVIANFGPKEAAVMYFTFIYKRYVILLGFSI